MTHMKSTETVQVNDLTVDSFALVWYVSLFFHYRRMLIVAGT